MTLRQGQLVLTPLVFSAAILAVILTSTETSHAADVCDLATTITLSANADGSCQQVGTENPAAAVPNKNPAYVTAGKCVKFTAAGYSLELQFEPGPLPVYDLKAAANQTVTLGPVGYAGAGTPSGKTYYYSSVQINGVYCSNGSQLGLI